jgi:transcriptional regulator with XRE-family HTH domain
MERPKTQRDIVRENLDAIKRMRAEGITFKEIAERLGVNIGAIDAILKPERTQRVNEARRLKRANEGQRKPHFIHYTEPRPEILGELPPPDTRDLTGRLLGDPLPGRSYLDRMRQQQGDAHG